MIKLFVCGVEEEGNDEMQEREEEKQVEMEMADKKELSAANEMTNSNKEERL